MNCKFDKEGIFHEDDAPIQPLIKKTITWDLLKSSGHIEGDEREIKALKRAFLKIGQIIPVKFKYLEAGHL